MKSIVARQKEPDSIEAGMAYREAYNKSKNYKAILWGFTFLLAVIQLSLTIIAKWELSLEVFSVVILIIYVLCNSFGKSKMKNWHHIGCKIQRFHDFYALNVGVKPPTFEIRPALIKELYEVRLSKYPNDRKDFEEWWNGRLDEISFTIGRLICSYNTFAWEVEIRNKYHFFLTYTLLGSVFLPLLLSLVLNYSVRETILLIVVPIIPFTSLVLEEWIENKGCINLSESIKNEVCTLWESTKERSFEESNVDSKVEELMVRWQTYRLNTLPIFEWLYNLTQKSMNKSMTVDTDKLINEVIESKL